MATFFNLLTIPRLIKISEIFWNQGFTFFYIKKLIGSLCKDGMILLQTTGSRSINRRFPSCYLYFQNVCTLKMTIISRLRCHPRSTIPCLALSPFPSPDCSSFSLPHYNIPIHVESLRYSPEWMILRKKCHFSVSEWLFSGGNFFTRAIDDSIFFVKISTKNSIADLAVSQLFYLPIYPLSDPKMPTLGCCQLQPIKNGGNHNR